MIFTAAASRATTLLARNPALFFRIAYAKIATMRRMPALPARKQMGGINFEYDVAGYHANAPMYFGSYALPVVETMRRFLHPGDTCIDVGANVGYLSAIAAGIVGTEGEVHCFEPVPIYFHRLRKLANLNPNHRIIVNACAAGETPGTATIYVTREAGQNTMVPDYKSREEITATLEIPVVRLDIYIESFCHGPVALIKIDAEGFEYSILKGLQGYFERKKDRPAILCEIAPRAHSLMGKKLSEVRDWMAYFGYAAYDPADASTRVDITALRHVEDVLFLAEPRIA